MKPDRRLMSRREFLIAAGCGCAATVLVGSGCARNSAAAAADTVICPYGYVYDTWPGQCPRYVDSNGSGYCDYSEPITATTGTTQAATESALSTAAGTTTTYSPTTSTALCDRHCSYPGRCARFVDSDNSGYCDWSESGVAAQAAGSAATATPAATTAATTTGSAAATATPAATATSAAATATAVVPTATAAALVVLCNRGCRTPGSCGRFTDANGSGICDLFEGVPADQAANYAQPGRRGRGG